MTSYNGESDPRLQAIAEAERAHYQNTNGHAKPNGNGANHDSGNKSPWLHDPEPIETLDFVTLADNPATTRAWAVPAWFPMLETVGLGGPGGEGKTLLAQTFATAQTLGETYLGLQFEQMKTALVLCEDRHNDAHWRQADINRSFGCRMSDLAGQLKIYPRRQNLYNYLGIFDQDGELHTTTFFDQLLADLKAFGAKVTYLDGRSDIFRGNQNDEQHARPFIRKITDRIAWETEGVVVLIYQPSRAGRVDGTGESGSAQWDAAFRARIYLEPARKDADPDTRRLVRKKSNFSAKDEEIEIRWNQGVFVPASEAAKPAYEVAAERMKAERVFLQMLDRFNGSGLDVSGSSSARNYAPRKFAEQKDHVEECTQEELEQAMTTLLFAKKIANATSGRSKRLARVENNETATT